MKRRAFWKPTATACLIILLAAFTFPQTAEASSFVVNTYDDVDDGICDATHCSLREAINAANASPGPDTITFDVPEGGSNIIRVTSPLPPLTDDATTIDATTLPHYNGYPVVFLGKDVAVVETGLLIESDGNLIRGLGFAGFGVWPVDYNQPAGAIVITGSANLIEGNVLGLGAAPNSIGLYLSGAGNSAVGNVISGNEYGVYASAPGQILQGNLVGLDSSGESASPNVYHGILLDIGSDGTLVGGSGPGEGNVIGANYIGIRATSDNITIQGNMIGTNRDGTVAIGNETDGLYLSGSDGTLVGGGGTGEGNVISGNGLRGIYLEANDITIQGNMIGTDASGSAALPNQEQGIYIHHGGEGTLVGGAGTGEGNIISGNGSGGLYVSAAHTTIQGNLIGLDTSGTSAIPNNAHGMVIYGSSTQIGGGGPGQGNVISGNEYCGIWISDDNNVIQGNFIGTDITGTALIPNGWCGIETEAYPNITIGGSSPDLGNVIMGNGSQGIWIDDLADGSFVENNIIAQNGGHGIELSGGVNNNTITQNSIFDNGGLGISIDFGMGDTNGGIEPPVLTGGLGGGTSGTACPGCLIEFFIADPDPSGAGEGKTFLDIVYANGFGAFNISLGGLGFCQQVTATATDPEGNTSEFSDNIFANCFQMPPLYLYPIWTFTIVVFGLLGWVVQRRRPDAPGRLTFIMAAGGGLLFLALILTLPFIQPEFTNPPACGNGVIESGETCDGDDLSLCLSGQICENCRCTTVIEMPVCGDGDVDQGEQCDGDDLSFCRDDQVCENCRCVTYVELCGNGVLDEGEQCDGDNLSYCRDDQVCENCRCVTPMEAEPLSEGCFYEALSNTYCRVSDYRESDPVAILTAGESALLVGLNPEYTHGLFELESGDRCWMWFNTLDGPENPLGTCGVQLVEPPDAPEVLVCRSNLNETDCIAAGGEWVVGMAPYCLCP